MNILITGGCGYIGSHLSTFFKKNDTVVLLDNFSNSKNKVIKNIKSIENYHIIDKIILDYQNIRKFSYQKFNSDFNFEDDKINLIYCFESNNIYKNCLFILDK